MMGSIWKEIILCPCPLTSYFSENHSLNLLCAFKSNEWCTSDKGMEGFITLRSLTSE